MDVPIQTAVRLLADAPALIFGAPEPALIGSNIGGERLFVSDPNAAESLIEELAQSETVIADRPPFIAFDYQWLIGHGEPIMRRIKNSAELRLTPIFCISNNLSVVDRSRLIALGVDELFQNSVKWDELIKRAAFFDEIKYLLAQTHPTTHAAISPGIHPLKRAIDIAGALTGILLSSPIMLLCAAMVRLESPGPILYRSKRVGKDYRVFEFLKFRTMCMDADTRLEELSAQNQYRANGKNAIFLKFKKDPRVTRFGRIMRKYSLDELPQLFNILRGEMSLVGNRPLPLYEAKQLTTNQWCARFLAPTGLTGLWQVSKRGRSEMSMEERIALDIQYAQKHNLITDLRILLATPFCFIQQEDV